MKKTALLFSILLLLNCTYLLAQTNPETPLYPNGIEKNPISHPNPETVVDSVINPLSLSHKNRVISNISIPTYQLFPASETNNKHIGVVILPGGGFTTNWVDKEGTDLAIWLSGQGINCMVVKYRTNRKDQKGEMIIPMDDYKGAVYQDVRAGILKMKELAKSLKIDSDKIGILGFSAGGWLSGNIAIKSTESKEPVNWKPAFVGLIYYGNTLSNIKKIDNLAALPPVFMAIARDDKKMPMKEIIPGLAAVAAEVNHSELHIYSQGDHGFGLGYDKGHSVSQWKDSFYSWLLDIYNK
ncbi:Acetyl esterase/lipase [Flavobacterium fluvii]|uniref:Acetyl esterase/lipase n=1 Tax=Flavobacterium fluvii TaxID=468056 RepID=A0A1M5IFG0_9FLAO|nr:alpha/beta hydrolase [Flavobacterium fluvii]SHG27078.1 Acetyl esterase/lipase [Flavobacterium fluvii]